MFVRKIFKELLLLDETERDYLFEELMKYDDRFDKYLITYKTCREPTTSC